MVFPVDLAQRVCDGFLKAMGINMIVAQEKGKIVAASGGTMKRGFNRAVEVDGAGAASIGFEL